MTLKTHLLIRNVGLSALLNAAEILRAAADDQRDNGQLPLATQLDEVAGALSNAELAG